MEKTIFFKEEIETHTHSGYSDGNYTDEAFYDKLYEIKRKFDLPLKIVCLTDHDTMNGLEPLLRIFRRRNEETGEEMELIPGIELTCSFGGREAHILGYFTEVEPEKSDAYLKPAAEKIIGWNEVRLFDAKVLGGLLAEHYQTLRMNFNLDYREAERSARENCQIDTVKELQKKAGDKLIWKPNVSRGYLRKQIEKQLRIPESGLQTFSIRRHSGAKHAEALKDFYRKNCRKNAHLIEEMVDKSVGIILYSNIESVSPVEAMEAVEAISKAGGAAVLAHPGENLLRQEEAVDLDRAGERLKEIALLIDFGLKGLEVYYPSHSPEQTKLLLQFAQVKGLAACGGSDWHGKSELQDSRVGKWTPGDMLEKLGICIAR